MEALDGWLGSKLYVNDKRPMITVLPPCREGSNLDSPNVVRPLTRQEAVVDVIGLAFVPVQEERGLSLLSVRFTGVVVVGAHKSMRRKARDHGGMV